MYFMHESWPQANPWLAINEFVVMVEQTHAKLANVIRWLSLNDEIIKKGISIDFKQAG